MPNRYQNPERSFEPQSYDSYSSDRIDFNRIQPAQQHASQAPRRGLQQSFQAQEAYKTARTNIDFAVIKSGCKIITITSALMGEGKTEFSSNLARAYAQIGENRVLLIDADMRKPMVHREFNIPNVPGLSNYLLQPDDLESMLSWLPNENLYILPSGITVPTASELLSSSRFSDLLDQLAEAFDYVIIDTPPVLVVSDALSTIPQTDGAVVVVRHNQTTMPQLRDTVDMIRNVNGKVLGVNLNAVPAKQSAYGYYADYGPSQAKAGD